MKMKKKKKTYIRDENDSIKEHRGSGKQEDYVNDGKSLRQSKNT